ncbi:uncharacterized protein LOC126322917 [Schistocerca gregaria]|uniref:uncharacterized protein LOC126322917 n=1 Tax=Schistocerca gregaria TaxID=7010 RepID=UPI00211E96C9|nr:uncharacterized protein LOC126322917 [Schistocerca gregaria]
MPTKACKQTVSTASVIPLSNKYLVLDEDCNKTANRDEPESVSKRPIKCTVRKIFTTNKTRNYKKRVLVLGDSHAKRIAEKMNEYSSSFTAAGITKPSAPLTEITKNSNSLNELSKNDTVIIMGGSNDVYRNEGKFATQCLKTTLLNLKVPNIVLTSMPHRNDLQDNSIVNLELTKINRQFRKICKYYQNVTFFELPNSRELFTKHGQHYNSAGKSCISKMLTKLIQKDDHAVRNTIAIQPVSMKEIRKHLNSCITSKSVAATASVQPGSSLEQEEAAPESSSTKTARKCEDPTEETVASPSISRITITPHHQKDFLDQGKRNVKTRR